MRRVWKTPPETENSSLFLLHNKKNKTYEENLSVIHSCRKS